MSLQKAAPISGLIGTSLILVCTFYTALGFEETSGESYSIMNHFISELGHTEWSADHRVFNYGLIFGGLFLVIFSQGITLGFTGKLRNAISVTALIAAVSCCLVGFFPADDFEKHVAVALGFFGMGLVTILIVTVLTFMGKTPALPKSSVVPGVITAISFTAFLLSPNDNFIEWVKDPENFVRPEIWFKTIIEWLCFFSMIGWIMMVSWIQLRSDLTA